MKVSLRTKATLLAGALVAAALAIVGLVQNRQLEQDFRDVVRAQLDTLGESIAEDLSGKLELHRTIAEREAATLDAAVLADPARAQAFVSRGAASRAIFDGLAIIGADGEVIASDPPRPPDAARSVADRPYFQRVRELDRTVLSEPILSRSGRGPMVLLVVPVRDGAGRPIAYYAGSLQLTRDNVLGTVGAAPVGRTGHLQIVTAGPAPVYIAHPDPARLLQPAAPEARGDLAVPYLSVNKPLRGADWTLRLVLPQWEADAPLLEARRRLLTALATVALGTAVLVWLAMTWLLRPLGRLNAMMERLRHEPTAVVELDLRGDDERGELARSFEDLMRGMRTRDAEVRAIAERSPLGMYRTGPDGRLVYANAAYLEMHGLAPEDAADGWLRLVDPAERDAAWAAWVAAVQRPEPFHITRDLRRADGRACQFVVRSAPVIVDGVVLGHVGTVFDATERNAQERALRVLTTIFDTTTDYVVQTDRQGFATYANPALRRLLGLAPDAPIGQLNFASFNTAQTQARYASEILPAVKAHGLWVGETVILAAGGREVPVSHMVIAHRDRRGRIEHFSAVMRDISASLEAQRQAERDAATLRSLAELSPATMTVVDNALRYRYVNSAFEHLVQRPRAEILGRHASEVLPPAAYEVSLPHARRALAGEAVHFERRSAAPGGQVVLAVSYLPIVLPTGEVDGFVGTAQDVTQHQREAQLWRARSQRDLLTGLLNRAGFDAALVEQVEAGGGDRLALLYLDLDRFKPVNDRLGHAAGDEVLRVVAARLQRLVRPTDIVARLGGDEFAIVLPDVPGAGIAQSVADKLAASLPDPIAVGGEQVSVGASIGVVYGLGAGETPEAFVGRADADMYRAKNKGRPEAA